MRIWRRKVKSSDFFRSGEFFVNLEIFAEKPVAGLVLSDYPELLDNYYWQREIIPKSELSTELEFHFPMLNANPLL